MMAAVELAMEEMKVRKRVGWKAKSGLAAARPGYGGGWRVRV